MDRWIDRQVEVHEVHSRKEAPKLDEILFLKLLSE